MKMAGIDITVQCIILKVSERKSRWETVSEIIENM